MTETAISTSYRDILYEVKDGIAIVTLNRPDRMNAWTQLMGLEICDAMSAANEDDDVRSVVLTGAGTRAFCAGADLQGGDKTFGQTDGDAAGASFNRVGLWPHQIDKPVIGAINGHAVGVGITLPMMCDIRFVAENAKIQFAFVKRGIVPELGSPVIVQKVCGFSRAADLLLSGRMFSGKDAQDYGIALEALPQAEVLPRALEYAREYASAAPVSVAISKRLMWDGMTSTVEISREKESALLAWIGQSADAKEGVNSFIEKRPPEWKMSADRDTPRDLLKGES